MKNNVNLATTTSITTTYAGEAASGYVAAALLSANTIENGGVTVHPNVKFKKVLNKIALNDVLKNASCDFSATSTVTKTERILTPEEFQVNLQLCKSDFDSDWSAIEMGYSAFDVLPKSFSDFLIAHVIEKVAAKSETNLWSGVTANDGEYDGFETIMTNQADQPTAMEIAGTTLTAGNIIAQARLLVDQQTSAMEGDPNNRLYMNAKTVRFYIQALGGFDSTITNAGHGNNGPMWYTNGDLSIDGVPIFVAKGMSDDVMMLTSKENLAFGTGLLSDGNLVKLIDMADIDGSKNVRFVMRCTAGAQIVNPEQVITYGITNSGN